MTTDQTIKHFNQGKVVSFGSSDIPHTVKVDTLTGDVFVKTRYAEMRIPREVIWFIKNAYTK